jgi:hypothetical protein
MVMFMPGGNRKRRLIPALIACAFLLVATVVRPGPPPQPTPNDALLVLHGNVPRFARPENDFGLSDPTMPEERIILLLKRSPAQETELERFLAEQQDPSSPNFHHWLSPEQFGERFGPSKADIAVITDWLQSQGFTIDEVAKGRTWINFSGTVAEVEAAFHTRIHDYLVKGRLYHSNDRDPAIPSELSCLVGGIVSLNNFPLKSMISSIRPVGSCGRQPEYYNGTYQFLAPADLATIYDVNPLYNASPAINGTGVTIAIVGRTHEKNFPNEITTFRQGLGNPFGLPANNPTIVVNGTDPGDLGSNEDTEADLDVEWSGAVAPNAHIIFVCSKSTATTDGVDLSAQYIVNNKTAPIMSTSFGQCESSLGTAENNFYNSLWQQAAAEGITAFVSAGDSGCSGCNAGSATTGSGLAVSGLASTPYDVCVGGTEFNEGSGTYWSTTNSTTNDSTALSYIPEEAWNESGTSCNCPAGDTCQDLWATGGGVSTLYSKPSWQVAPGVPADGMRDVPDVSLSAAGHDGYLIYTESGPNQWGWYSVGGTSAASPSWAGLMALIEQKTGQWQGNANIRLYQLGNNQYARSGPVVFHDITTCNNTVPGVTGYSCTTAYDQSTGLGTPDAYALASNWFASVWNAKAGSSGYQTPAYTTPGTDILTKFWIVGAGGANNSGTLSTASMITGNGQTSGKVYPFSAWGSTGTAFAAPHPNPSAGQDRTAFLYSVANGGNAQYLVMSVGGDGFNFNYDGISNGTGSSGNVCSPAPIPTLTINNSVENSDGSYDVTVSWTPITALKGYYDTSPANNLITGAAIRYQTNSTKPTNFLTGAWTLAAGGPNSRTGYVSWGNNGSDPGTLTVRIPGSIPSGQATYLAMSLLFDGATPGTGSGWNAETDFVGPASLQIGPTPAGVFASFGATLRQGRVSATWRSNVEAAVLAYDVQAAPRVGGQSGVFASMETLSPLGDGHNYIASFKVPKAIRTKVFYVRVVALLRNGGQETTPPRILRRDS